MELLSAFRHGNQDCGPHASDQNLSESWRGCHVFIKNPTTRTSDHLFSISKSVTYCWIKFGTSFALQIAGLLFPEQSIMPQRQSGFTLIEIAIVLVIIGLLLGGILKGQELINSARVKNLATDFRNIPLFIYGYQDKFRALPGDDLAVVAHLGTDATVATPAGTLGNGEINGAWNQIAPSTSESFLFWQHVRLAGLAPGPTSTAAGDYAPTNSVGGRIGIQSAAPFTGIKGTYFICSDGIQGKFVRQLDTQLDDGNTETGSMMAGSALPAAIATNLIVDASVYTVCMGI